MRRHRLDKGAAGVVRQHHDMGRFQRGTGAHLHAGRDAAFHRAFAGTHGAGCAAAVAVGFQIHHAHKALPHLTALLGAFHVNKAVHRAGQHVPGIVIHGGMDLLNACIGIAVLQIDLRQDHVQGAGAACCGSLGFLPVIPVTGELIAGNAAPLFQWDLLRRQKDVGRCKAGFRVHSRSLPFTITKAIHVLFTGSSRCCRSQRSAHRLRRQTAAAVRVPPRPAYPP